MKLLPKSVSIISITALILCTNIQTLHAAEYKRIVSFLPSITEILFALGEGEHVVGVTRYCEYPPEAEKITKIGGVLDTSYEKVLSLNPDLCIVAASSEDQVEILGKMGLEVMDIETRSIKGVLAGIEMVGIKLGRKEEAQKIVNEINRKITDIKLKVAGTKKPRVLITFLRPLGEGHIRDVYIAGHHTFFNDLIEFAGGANAYQGTDFITSPIVTAEGILEMNPDVILEIMTTLEEYNVTKEDAYKDWQMLSELDAYQNKRVHILDQQYIKLPGPRLGMILDTIAPLIHPELMGGGI